MVGVNHSMGLRRGQVCSPEDAENVGLRIRQLGFDRSLHPGHPGEDRQEPSFTGSTASRYVSADEIV